MRPPAPWPGPRTSAAALLLANAVPLIGVVGFGWDLHSLLVVYWLESAVVGASFAAKIRRAEGSDDPATLPAMSFNGRSVRSFVGAPNRRVVRFFLGHYGGFWVVHGAFVLLFPAIFPGLDPARPRVVGLAVASLATYHVLSYWVNYVGEREYERTGPVTLMVEPYRRVFVLHLTIVLGAFVVAAVGAPVGALVVMVVVKAVLDLRGHRREHERKRERPPSTAA